MAQQVVKILFAIIVCKFIPNPVMFAQETHSYCGVTPENLLLNTHEMVTGISTEKTNLVHPCGASGTVNLRVVVHFMLNSDGSGNFNEYNDGRTSSPIPSGGDPDYHYKWNG